VRRRRGRNPGVNRSGAALRSGFDIRRALRVERFGHRAGAGPV